MISILRIGSLRSPPPIRLCHWTHLRCEGSEDAPRGRKWARLRRRLCRRVVHRFAQRATVLRAEGSGGGFAASFIMPPLAAFLFRAYSQRTADSRQRIADSRQRTADSRQPIADSRQPIADSGQPTAVISPAAVPSVPAGKLPLSLYLPAWCGSSRR